jgi:hypothetical protein
MESLQIGKEKTSGAKALIIGHLYGPAKAVP